MFRGRFEHFIDAKGRTSLPVKFREILREHFQDERLMVTNFDGCLWAYPTREWERVENRVAELPQFKKEVKAIQRVFISAAQECCVDKQGRILIAPTLREYAGLKRDLIFVGAIRRIEIWDKERWEKVFRKEHEDIGSMGEALAEFGL